MNNNAVAPFYLVRNQNNEVAFPEKNVNVDNVDETGRNLRCSQVGNLCGRSVNALLFAASFSFPIAYYYAREFDMKLVTSSTDQDTIKEISAFGTLPFSVLTVVGERLAMDVDDKRLGYGNASIALVHIWYGCVAYNLGCNVSGSILLAAGTNVIARNLFYPYNKVTSRCDCLAEKLGRLSKSVLNCFSRYCTFYRG